MKYIPLTLDNLVYNLTIKENEDITFILPHKTPNFVPADKNKFVSANEVEIKVYISTDTEPLPKVVFVGQDDNSKIVMNGSFELLPSSLVVITFSTIDGGATWLVNSCSANGATAEGAETIAKNAESVAVNADKNATSALTEATEAVSTARDAQGKAENAGVTAQAAVTSANAAVDTASEAQRIANNAADEAANASRRVVDIANDVTQLGENITEVDGRVTDVQSTADNAKTAASNAQNTADNALEKANNSLQLKSETEYQKIETGLVLGKAKKLLLEKANGSTPLGMAMNQYDELTDKATGAGLEQVEIGTTQVIMCLNHCGAEFTTANGETKVVDGHIRVDYKEKADAPTMQDQLAYMSDIKAIQEQLATIIENQKIIIEHTKNTENLVFWIDSGTLQPTREWVDPDTLTPLPSYK